MRVEDDVGGVQPPRVVQQRRVHAAPEPASETSASIESATQSRKMPVWLPAPEN